MIPEAWTTQKALGTTQRMPHGTTQRMPHGTTQRMLHGMTVGDLLTTAWMNQQDSDKTTHTQAGTTLMEAGMILMEAMMTAMMAHGTPVSMIAGDH